MEGDKISLRVTTKKCQSSLLRNEMEVINIYFYNRARKMSPPPVHHVLSHHVQDAKFTAFCNC